MGLRNRTLNIREDQEQRIIRLAAERQLELGHIVGISEIARLVIDAGLDAIERSKAESNDGKDL